MNELTEAVSSFNNNCLFTPTIRKVRKLSSTSTSITTVTNVSNNNFESSELQTPEKFCSPSPSSSFEPVTSKRIKVISNILLRAAHDDIESESYFIVERSHDAESCDSLNTHKVEARNKLEILKRNVSGEVDKITEATKPSTDQCEEIKQAEIDCGDIPPSQPDFYNTRHCVDTELKTLFKYAYFLFEKLLSPNTTKNEIRTIFKHSYFMFTNALTVGASAEGYRDLLEICEILKKYAH